MTSPLISVIVPVYNGQDYVIKCIKSIEKQSYSPLEIIVVDDGSTDDTRNVLEGYVSVSKSANIKLIGLNDLGVSAARNAGINASTGDYLTFVDADDILLPDTISRLYDALIENDADVAGCSFIKWSKRDEVTNFPADSHTGTKSVFTSSEYLSQAILNENSRCWSKLYRRSLFENVSFMEGLTIGEDMLFLIDLLPHVKKWVETDYSGYGYFQNPKGAMYRPFNLKYLDQIKCWLLAREHASQYGFFETEPSAESKITRNLIMGVMLVVGKLAMLTKVERSLCADVITDIHCQLQNEIKNKDAYRMLPFGYKIKVSFFKWFPEMFMGMYHGVKKTFL